MAGRERLQFLRGLLPELMNTLISSHQTLAELGAQATASYRRALSGMRDVLVFWGAVKLLQLAAEAAEEGVYSTAENKPFGGRPHRGNDLKAVFARYAPEIKHQTAYKLMTIGDSVAADYEQIVGARAAKQLSMPELVTTPAEKLPEAMRAKQLDLFEAVDGTSKQSWLDKMHPQPDGRSRNPGGFRPNGRLLRAWLSQEYPDTAEAMIAKLDTGTFADLPEDVRKRYNAAEETRYEARLTKAQYQEIEDAENAKAWNAQIVPAITLGLDGLHYLRADDATLEALETALKDLLTVVSAQRQERAGKRPARALK